MAEKKAKSTSLADRARIFLTPLSTYNLFPELDSDLNLGNKPDQIAYNVTRLILNQKFDGIIEKRGYARDEPGNTVMISTKREGAELLSLALQIQGFQDIGTEVFTEDKEGTKYIKLTREYELTVENGVLIQKNPGGPIWENLSQIDD